MEEKTIVVGGTGCLLCLVLGVPRNLLLIVSGKINFGGGGGTNQEQTQKIVQNTIKQEPSSQWKFWGCTACWGSGGGHRNCGNGETFLPVMSFMVQPQLANQQRRDWGRK